MRHKDKGKIQRTVQPPVPLKHPSIVPKLNVLEGGRERERETRSTENESEQEWMRSSWVGEILSGERI